MCAPTHKVYGAGDFVNIMNIVLQYEFYNLVVDKVKYFVSFMQYIATG